MGFLKRMFGGGGSRASSLLAKIGGAQRGSHQLVCMGPNGRQSLNLVDQHGLPTSGKQVAVNPLIEHFTLTNGQSTRSKRSSSSSKTKRRDRATDRESNAATAAAAALLYRSIEAEMLDTMSRMPALKFHSVHGPSAELSQDLMSARRTQSFCQAIVFSDRLIMPNERVYIRVLDIAKGWNGTIRFGFTACDPDSFRYEPMPKHACPDMTKVGHTWAYALADELVKRDTVIHFSYTPSGFIQYGINNQDFGVFRDRVTSAVGPFWFVIDIYGLTTAIELLDPRVHNWPNQENFATSSQVAAQRRLERRTAKLASHYHQKFTPRTHTSHFTGSTPNRFTSPLSNTNAPSAELYGSLAGSYIPHQSMDGHYQHRVGAAAAPARMLRPNDDLPNLSSILLPTSRQNIYTALPLPAATSRANNNNRLNHRSNQNSSDYQHYYQLNPPTAARAAVVQQQYEMDNDNYVAAELLANPARATSTSISAGPLTSTPSRAMRHGRRASEQEQEVVELIDNVDDDEDAGAENVGDNDVAHVGDNVNDVISERLNNLELTRQNGRCRNSTAATISSTNNSIYVNGNNSTVATASAAASSSSSSNRTTYANRGPIAATRKNVKIASKIPHSSHVDTRDSRAISATTTNSQSSQSAIPRNPKSSSNKTITNKHINNNNQQSKRSVSTNGSSRDKNNDNPITKDCPICFERPINCVLYQCGHMCTCYECGVKQWRTQSRTCPICRTVIKDVIKTYLS